MTAADVKTRGWGRLFDASRIGPPSVEIGFGRGEFLMDLAANHPERSYVGIECSYKRVLKMARRVAKTEIANLRIVEGFAESLVAELFAQESVAEFWINFPDPWPKRNHARRRVVRPEVIERLASFLVPGGLLHAATDDPTYAGQMDAVFAAEGKLENEYSPRPWLSAVPGRLPTAYELEWRARGRPLHFFAYRRHS